MVREGMMILSRHLAFWLLAFFVLAAMLWLLHDVLLPFVLGMALAYVQAPIADRMERLGINRTVAALLMVSLVVVALVALVLLLVPLLLQQGSALISHIPGYFKRVQEMLVDPDLPWINWFAGEDKNKTVSDLVGQAATWLAGLYLFVVDRRQGSGLVRVDPDRDAYRHLLSDLRLACDDRHHRQLGAGAPA